MTARAEATTREDMEIEMKTLFTASMMARVLPTLALLWLPACVPDATQETDAMETTRPPSRMRTIGMTSG